MAYVLDDTSNTHIIPLLIVNPQADITQIKIGGTIVEQNGATIAQPPAYEYGQNVPIGFTLKNIGTAAGKLKAKIINYSGVFVVTIGEIESNSAIPVNGTLTETLNIVMPDHNLNISILAYHEE